MEAVAAVSSVAGIASLVGQALVGLSSLYDFFKDCRDASKTIDQFVRAVVSLERTIKDVESLVHSAKNVHQASIDSNLASLAIHMEDCTKDINRWLKEAQSCHPGYGPWTKSVFKKFLVAVKKQSIKDVFQEIAVHRESISLILITTGRLVVDDISIPCNLTRLNRFLDIQNLNKSGALNCKVDEIAAHGKVTMEALGRLEIRFHQFGSDKRENSRSLSSIASQLSRIESLLSVGPGTDSRSTDPGYTYPPPLVRRGSTSSLYRTCSGLPPERSGSPRNSRPSSPISVSQITMAEKMQRAKKTMLTIEKECTGLPPISELLNFKGYSMDSRDDSGPSRLFGEPKIPESGAILDFFHAFEGLIAYAGAGSISKCLTDYIRYYQVAETTNAHIRMLSALAPLLNLPESSTMNLKFQEAQEKTRKHLRDIEYKRDRYRGACWRQGYDVVELDRELEAPDKAPDIRQEIASEQHHMSWWDVLHHVGSQDWLTKKDRINSWLLQNLAAEPGEALCHRKCLQEEGMGDQLSEEEWARLVLKFWTIDDAAQPLEHTECSTNGAVDSDGACNSTRVKLVGSLPIREKVDAMDIDSESEISALDIGGSRKRKRGDE